MTAPLMPKATAVWLVENTSLTFRQISKFCEIHELEIQAIADGNVAYNIVGLSPINNNQLTWEEIHRCEADSHADLVPNVLENNVKERNAKAKKLLTPTQRSEKPAAILWILQQFPNIIDSQIAKLIGTTKPTIMKIRNGEYKNMAELKPKNPITLGLCDEVSLEKAVNVSENMLKPKTKKKKTTKKKVAKKVVAKKVAAKKTTKAKAATKKVAAKKTTKAKAATKKVAAKKTTKAKAATKKVAAKKTTKAKVATKKTAAKKTTKAKAATKKAAAKKTTKTKAATKKVAAKKTTKKTVAKAAKK